MALLRGYEALEDPALVALVVEGDSAALEALFGRYGQVGYALARHILADEQLAQDVVCAVWRETAYDPARGGFATWLLATIHHRSVDVVRREEKLHRCRAADLAALADGGGSDEVWSGLRHDRARDALAALPDTEREALVLAYFGGYTQHEVATLTGTPLGVVRTRMLAALRHLRDTLDDVIEATDESSWRAR